MAVKSKQRHRAKTETLQKARELMNYILILTRPREFDYKGKQICKPGLLGEGQPLQAFGTDLLKCGKSIHAACYEGCNISLKNEDTFKQRTNYWRQAIRYCDSIFRQIDLCIFQYARYSRTKQRSFEHLAQLTKAMKDTLQDRLNRDQCLYKQYIS